MTCMAISATSSPGNVIANRMAEIANRMAGIANRMAEIANRMAGIANRMAGIANRMAGRVVALLASQADLVPLIKITGMMRMMTGFNLAIRRMHALRIEN